MPIVVTILGIILVAMSVAFFTISPKEDSLASDTDASRTEAMEIEAEAEITLNTPATPEPEIDTNDTVAEAVATVTLSGEGTYSTPARLTHTVDVTLTLEGDVVTDVAVDFNKGAGPANDHQKRFSAAYRTEVVGKTLSQVSLSRVGGASLTSGGFNQAVAAIKSQHSS